MKNPFREARRGPTVEPTLLIFAEAFRLRPDLAPGREAFSFHRLPWLHRAVPSATLDERFSFPKRDE